MRRPAPPRGVGNSRSFAARLKATRASAPRTRYVRPASTGAPPSREESAPATRSMERDPMTVAPALANAATASYMAGEVPTALATELRAAALVPEEGLALLVRVRMLVAEALADQHRWEESLHVYAAALDVAETLGAKTPAD